jgi:hypothetical protein
MTYALHDADSPVTKFVGSNDYHTFRDGIIRAQVDWLHSVYDKYISDEYPELTPDMADLEDQAVKK